MKPRQLKIVRTASQIVFFLLLAVFLVGTFCSVSLGRDYYLSCPLGVLQLTLGAREMLVGAIVSGLLLIGLTLALGRVFCGWICPFGALADWLHKPLARCRIARDKVAPALSPDNKVIKYGVLGGVLLAAGLFRSPAFCTVCPVGTTCRTAGLQGVNIGLETAAVPVILSLETVNRRFWCKVLCPIGALLAFFSRFRLAKIRLPFANCAGCNRCEQACAMDNSPRQGHERLKTDPAVLKALIEYGVPDLLDRPGQSDRAPQPIKDLLAAKAGSLSVPGAECTSCYSCVAACPVLNRQADKSGAVDQPAGISA
jgi:ferredoxin-type protein NapH